MNLTEAFDSPYKLTKVKNPKVELVYNILKSRNCKDIDIFKVVDLTDRRIYILSYVYDGAIETHIVNDELLYGGQYEDDRKFKRSEFSRMIASSIMVSVKKVKEHNLPVRFWSDDDRKTDLYKKALGKFKDAEIIEVENYRTINGDTRNVWLVRKKG